jgi:hypothetical protein
MHPACQAIPSLPSGPGVDDVDSECALDGATFDVTIVNDGDQAGYDCQIQALLTTIEQSMAN